MAAFGTLDTCQVLSRPPSHLKRANRASDERAPYRRSRCVMCIKQISSGLSFGIGVRFHARLVQAHGAIQQDWELPSFHSATAMHEAQQHRSVRRSARKAAGESGCCGHVGVSIDFADRLESLMRLG
jgi:hypothetical protein